MTLAEFYKKLENFAPKAISDEYCRRYDAYDNSGVLLNCGEEVKKVLFSLDFSSTALDRAVETEANVIVTHHPAIYGKIGEISVDTPLGNKLQRAIKNGISVISMHLNFDCVRGGIDEYLAQGIGKKGETVIFFEPLNEESGVGYGRVYDVETIKAKNLAERLKNTFSTERIICYGEEKEIKRAASFCGAGASESGIAFAAKHGADCVISSDFKHHLILLALEYGMSVIALTHYAAENYGFERIYQKLKTELGVKSEYFCDRALL
ncbi:MAG: Nif3-like dinuclear metal center hexameric protein [Clostridia bacterium]|nr:Nif3-like dinuclear metal center hexameric protein [Clostridia bacterium]